MTTPRGSRTGTDGRRLYEFRGRSYPSVTTLLRGRGQQPGLVQWMLGRVIARVIDEGDELDRLRADPKALRKWLRDAVEDAGAEAREFGNRFHEAADRGLKPSDFADDPDLRRTIAHFYDFLDDGFTVIAKEFTVVNETLGYAGTADALVRDESTGDLLVLDWKTSRTLQADYVLQVVAYLGGEVVVGAEPDSVDDRLTSLLARCAGGGIVRFRPEGWTLWTFPYLDAWRETWAALVRFTTGSGRMSLPPVERSGAAPEASLIVFD